MENDPYAGMSFPTGGKKFGKKPHIKLGYYPGKLVDVKLFNDADGNPIVSRYGKQLILSFQIYDKDDADPANALKPLQHKNSETGATENVEIPMFVYYEYKDSNKDGSWTSGIFRTAFTKGGKITKIMEAFGWKFQKDSSVNPGEFVGTFVNLNVGEYDHKSEDEIYKASTIKEVLGYDGKIPGATEEKSEEIPPEEKPHPDQLADEGQKEPEKKVELVEEKAKPVEKKEETESPATGTEKSFEDKKIEMKKMLDDKLLTEDGYKQAISNIDKQIEESKKEK